MAWSWLIMAGCLASCSFEVRSLARGRQHPGMVSIRVGLEWVRRGFMKLSSTEDHQVWSLKYSILTFHNQGSA